MFFTIFHTLMCGPKTELKETTTEADENAPLKKAENPYYEQYPADFFDLIIIDERHRGGANDESAWRDILKYFEPAVQLGLTATPKRTYNADTYGYFGEPV